MAVGGVATISASGNILDNPTAESRSINNTPAVNQVTPADAQAPVIETEVLTIESVNEAVPDTLSAIFAPVDPRHHNIYLDPYSLKGTAHPDWQKMWTNTAVLSGAFVTALFVLECLPEDATAWNRESLQSKPFYKRWYDNIFVKSPEIDHDKPIFNYILHPYAGAAYFMSARSCGFSFLQSMIYSACISTVEWEFGIEACMERPSYQDILITPLIGSALGELFFMAKHHIVNHDYTLWGSRVLGNIVVFLFDPVNEVINLFRGSDERRLHLGRKVDGVTDEKSDGFTSTLLPTMVYGAPGFSFRCTF